MKIANKFWIWLCSEYKSNDFNCDLFVSCSNWDEFLMIINDIINCVLDIEYYNWWAFVCVDTSTEKSEYIHVTWQFF